VALTGLVAGGPDWVRAGAALALLAAGAMAAAGSWYAAPAAFLAVAGAFLGTGTQAVGLVACSGLLAAISGEAFPERAMGLFGALLAAQTGGLSGTWAVIGAAVPAIFLERGTHRMAISLLLLPASILAFGFPSPSEAPEVLLQESFAGGGESWPGTANLDQSTPVCLLRVVAPTEPMRVVLDAGGVRDSLPVGFVSSDDGFVPVFPGRDTLTLADPGLLVEIRLVRPPAPFQHAVIHAGPAWAVRQDGS